MEFFSSVYELLYRFDKAPEEPVKKCTGLLCCGLCRCFGKREAAIDHEYRD
jgi:hypothetical protein